MAVQRERHVADYFDGGQHCDETGKGRHTMVNFRCCGDGDVNSGEGKGGGRGKRESGKQNGGKASIKWQQQAGRGEKRGGNDRGGRGDESRRLATFASIREVTGVPISQNNKKQISD